MLMRFRTTRSDHDMREQNWKQQKINSWASIRLIFDSYCSFASLKTWNFIRWKRNFVSTEPNKTKGKETFANERSWINRKTDDSIATESKSFVLDRSKRKLCWLVYALLWLKGDRTQRQLKTSASTQHNSFVSFLVRMLFFFCIFFDCFVFNGCGRLESSINKSPFVFSSRRFLNSAHLFFGIRLWQENDKYHQLFV